MKILITADWHVRGEKPVCRTEEDWIASQRETISSIRQVFFKEECEQIWILGDLFDAPKCSTAAVNMLIDELKKVPVGSVKVLCGNHDLKDHRYDNLEECSIGIITKIFDDIPGCVYRLCSRSGTSTAEVSAKPFGLDDYGSVAEIVCTHQLTFPDEESRPFEDCGVLAQELLDKWASADIVFTGDYHHAFIHEEKHDGARSRYVVNPGCINIQKADELDYLPRVYVWSSDICGPDIKPFKAFFLDPQSKFCTRDHIEAREERDSRLSEVVETIKDGTDVTLDFDSNLENAVKNTDLAIIGEYEELKQQLNGETK